MINIDFSRNDIMVIRDSLIASNETYQNAVGSRTYDLGTITAMISRMHEIESVLAKIEEWLG